MKYKLQSPIVVLFDRYDGGFDITLRFQYPLYTLVPSGVCMTETDVLVWLNNHPGEPMLIGSAKAFDAAYKDET